MRGGDRGLLAANGITGAREGHPITQRRGPVKKDWHLHAEAGHGVKDETGTLGACLGKVGNHPAGDVAAARLAGAENAFIDDGSSDINLVCPEFAGNGSAQIEDMVLNRGALGPGELVLIRDKIVDRREEIELVMLVGEIGFRLSYRLRRLHYKRRQNLRFQRPSQNSLRALSREPPYRYQ